MNDITALMATMKAAAENLDGDTWHDEGASVYGGAYDVGDTVCYDHIVDCENVNGESLVAEFIAIANPANVKMLAEALEKAQQKVDVYDMLREDYGLCEKGVGLADFVDWQAKRIAELESRTVTVKLPPRVDSSNVPFTAHTWNCCLDAVEKCLTAAGIHVIEGEG